MAFRSVLVALLGVAVAGASAFATREYMAVQTANASTDPAAELASVVVAATDIAYGQPIEPQSLSVIPWPKDALPQGAFHDTANLLPPAGQPPRRATRALSKGDLLLASKVSGFGEKVTIVQSLGPNERAMAIKVSAATAVGGFVTPGDSVDIVMTQGHDTTLRAITILQNIRVIGVDQVSDENHDQPDIARTVTVGVTPEQGQILALAEQAGTLSLTLRSNATAAKDEPLASIRLNDILRDTSPVEAPKVAGTTIKVHRGTEPVQLVEVK